MVRFNKTCQNAGSFSIEKCSLECEGFKVRWTVSYLASLPRLRGTGLLRPMIKILDWGVRVEKIFKGRTVIGMKEERGR